MWTHNLLHVIVCSSKTPVPCVIFLLVSYAAQFLGLFIYRVNLNFYHVNLMLGLHVKIYFHSFFKSLWFQLLTSFGYPFINEHLNASLSGKG